MYRENATYINFIILLLCSSSVVLINQYLTIFLFQEKNKTFSSRGYMIDVL